MKFALLCIEGDTKEEVCNIIENNFISKNLSLFQNEKKLSLSIIYKNRDDLSYKLNKSLKLLYDNDSISDPEGIYFTINPFGHKSLAFLFPGQGSQYHGMLDAYNDIFALYKNEINESKNILEKIDQKILENIFSQKTEESDLRLKDTRYAQPAIGLVSDALAESLKSINIHPTFYAGHSYGEITSLKSSGVLNKNDFLEFSAQRGRLMGQAGEKAPGAMLALSCELDEVQELLKLVDNKIEISNYNAPGQTIVSGKVDLIDEFERLLVYKNIKCIKLNTSAAFHSSLMKPVAEDWRNFLSRNKGSFNQNFLSFVFNNVNAKIYQQDADFVVDTLSDHLIKPVKWIQLIEKMYDSGIRIFLEVGPKNVLTGLVKKIMGSRSHLSIACDYGKREPLEYFLNLIGFLKSHGIPVRWKDFFDQSVFENEKIVTHISGFFFEENYRVLESFFNSQEKIINVISKTKAGSKKDGLIKKLFVNNNEIINKFVENQSIANKTLNFQLDDQSVIEESYSNELETKIMEVGAQDEEKIVKEEKPKENNFINRRIFIKELKNDNDNNNKLSKEYVEQIELWLAHEISDVTGFPKDMIKTDTFFEKDLGLESITMMKIFMKLLKKFPEIEKHSDRIRKIKSLNSLYELFEELQLVEKDYSKRTKSSKKTTSQIKDSLKIKERANLKKISSLYRHINSWEEVHEWLLERITKYTGRIESEIEMTSDFQSELNLNLFQLEKILNDLINMMPAIAVAGRELLNSRNLNELKRIINKIITPARHLKIGIIGSNYMGLEVAKLFVEVGFEVTLIGSHSADVDKFVDESQIFLSRIRKKDKINENEFLRRLSGAKGILNYDTDEFKNFDFIVESTTGSLLEKQNILKTIEPLCSNDTILCCYVATVSINDLAVVLKNKKRFVGLRFFQPLEYFRPVEVIRSKYTSDETIDSSILLIRDIGKTAILVNDSPGFFINRILTAVFWELFDALEKGWFTIDEIDELFSNSVFLLAPLVRMDLSGLEQLHRIMLQVSEKFPERFSYQKILQLMMDSGRIGKESGKGFYNYSGGEIKIDQEIQDMLNHYKTEAHGSLPGEVLIEKCILRTINETLYCVEEGVVSVKDAAKAIRALLQLNKEFFKYIEKVGLITIYNKMKQFEKDFGHRFKPPTLMEKIINNDTVISLSNLG